MLATDAEREKTHRKAALNWLAHIVCYGPREWQATASEVKLAWTANMPLGPKARRWLERQRDRGDVIHSGWARTILKDLDDAGRS